MRISDWSSDVCSSDLDAAASRFARTANRLRRAALMSLLPLPKLGALASGQCQLQLRQTICARVTPSWRLTNYSASQKRRCAEYALRSEEHTSELQSLMRISYAVFCLKKNKKTRQQYTKN